MPSSSRKLRAARAGKIKIKYRKHTRIAALITPSQRPAWCGNLCLFELCSNTVLTFGNFERLVLGCIVFALEYSFFSISQGLQDLHPFASVLNPNFILVSKFHEISAKRFASVLSRLNFHTRVQWRSSISSFSQCFDENVSNSSGFPMQCQLLLRR